MQSVMVTMEAKATAELKKQQTVIEQKPFCSTTIRTAQLAVRNKIRVKVRPPAPRFNAIPGYLGN